MKIKVIFRIVLSCSGFKWKWFAVESRLALFVRSILFICQFLLLLSLLKSSILIQKLWSLTKKRDGDGCRNDLNIESSQENPSLWRFCWFFFSQRYCPIVVSHSFFYILVATKEDSCHSDFEKIERNANWQWIVPETLSLEMKACVCVCVVDKIN